MQLLLTYARLLFPFLNIKPHFDAERKYNAEASAIIGEMFWEIS